MSKKDNDQILERLDRIEAKVEAREEHFFTFEEGADFLGLSPSYLYKLTHQNAIPFYRPGGKKIYFKRSELEQWIDQSRVCSRTELGYCTPLKFSKNSTIGRVGE